jgi:hypothetical protein
MSGAPRLHGTPESGVGFVVLTHTVPDAVAAIAIPNGAVRFSIMSVATVAFQVYGTTPAVAAVAPTAPGVRSTNGTAGTVSNVSFATSAAVTDIRAMDIPCAGAANLWCEGTGGISTVVIRWDLAFAG